MDGQPPLVQTLASPELRIFDSWEGDRRRRRWWRGSSHLTVRTVPKNVRLRSLFWNGGGEIYSFPEVLVILVLRFGIFYFAAFVGLRPIGALPQTLQGRCP